MLRTQGRRHHNADAKSAGLKEVGSGGEGWGRRVVVVYVSDGGEGGGKWRIEIRVKVEQDRLLPSSIM
jgi:hypothetical protein